MSDRSGWPVGEQLLRVLLVAAAMATTLWSLPASPAAQRTFVASNGSDANACSRAHPCRSFTAAIAQTNAGGEVIVLDSAGYGPALITQSVSIIAPPGVHAGITATPNSLSGNGIVVSAGANDVVVLRNLSIVGEGAPDGGYNGIHVSSAKEVHIENCRISGMQFHGVRVQGGAYVRVAGSTLRANAFGIGVSGATTLTVDGTHAVGNRVHGYAVGGSADATIRDSTATANGEHGLTVSPSVGAPKVTVTGGEFSRNGSDGIYVDAGLANEIRFSLFAASVVRNDARGVLLESTRANSVLRASIAASQIAANTAFGVSFGAAAGGVAYGRISHCSVNENGNVGLLSAGTTGAVMSIKGNTVARNGVADVRQLSSAVLYTFGDNALTGNGSSDVLGSLTSRSLR